MTRHIRKMRRTDRRIRSLQVTAEAPRPLCGAEHTADDWSIQDARKWAGKPDVLAEWGVCPKCMAVLAQ